MEVLTGYDKMAHLSQRWLEQDFTEIAAKWSARHRNGVTTASGAAIALGLSRYKFAKILKRYPHHIKPLYGESRFALYKMRDVHWLAELLERDEALARHNDRIAKYKRDFNR